MENINLIKFLKECDNYYYNTEKTLISDLEYDQLKTKAKELFPNDSYFEEIGSSPLRQKVSLPYILGSLEKKKLDTIDKWLTNNKVNLVISEKIDGSSIFVQYKNGNLIFSATRGTGFEGTNLYQKALIFCPKKINVDFLVDARGEVYLTQENYEKLNKKYFEEFGKTYTSKRNAVAGVLNRDDLFGCEFLSVKFYEHLNPEIRNSEYDRFYNLNKYGLPTVKYIMLQKDEKNKVEFLVKFLEEAKQQKYLVDGVVIAIDDSVREDVRYPKNKISFKVNEDAVPCKVVGIKWQITRSGRLVPVIEIEPTEISGALISNVMGHNYQNIKEQKIKPGTIIGVIRAGEIIPYLDSVIENTDDEAEIPETCPFCGEKLEISGVDIICVNDSCEQKISFKVEHFFRTLDAESFSKTTLEKLPISSILDAYLLTENSFKDLKGFGEKRIAKILEEIEKTKNTTKDKLLSAFGIPSLSTSTSTKIISYCEENNMNTFEEVFQLTKYDLISIDGIGEKNTQKILEGLLIIQKLYNQFKENNIVFNFPKKEKQLIYSGEKYCFTGSGPLGRKDLISLLESKGYEFVDVSKADFLVCEDVNGNSSKLKKAKQKGIKLISYEEFMEKMK